MCKERVGRNLPERQAYFSPFYETNIDFLDLMFVVPYILVTCLILVQLDIHYILYFLDNVSCIRFVCNMHPSLGAQPQRTAIDFIWFFVLFHWSRYSVSSPVE
jgi:hypothetical protein